MFLTRVPVLACKIFSMANSTLKLAGALIFVIMFAVLAACANSPARTSVERSPRASLWTPQTPFPVRDGDLAYIRDYAAANGWTYSPVQERTALLQMFDYRAERANFPGYAQVWGDRDTPHVNVKPPYDAGALLALASPELRPHLVINEVPHNRAEQALLQEQLYAILSTLRDIETGASYNYRVGRFEVDVVGEANAQTIRRLLPERLSAVTTIRAAEGPLFVQ